MAFPVFPFRSDAVSRNGHPGNMIIYTKGRFDGWRLAPPRIAACAAAVRGRIAAP